MATHAIGSRAQWLEARRDLLQAEKALTHQSDELARRRQALPWVLVDKKYEFDTAQGRQSLPELFQGRSQLMIYHFMFGPDYTAGCPSCSSIADGINGIFEHLANHDVSLIAVSRAPLGKLQAYKGRMGWSFPWASSLNGEFNFDFNVSFTQDQQRKGLVEYNFERTGSAPKGDASKTPVGQVAAMCGTDVATFTRDLPGLSTFRIENGAVYHTYSTYARGLDGLWGMYQWLDRAPKGRNETGFWIRRRDEYSARETGKR